MSGIYGEGYYLLIAACGKIPDDIKLYQLSALDMKLAAHRVIPFEFLGEEEEHSPAMCIAPEWWATFDKIVGSQKRSASVPGPTPHP